MSKETNELKPIDTPVYGYWSALYHSFYSRRLYVDVGKRWKGVGALYLLLALAVFSLPFFIQSALKFNQEYKESITQPLLKIPVFYIQNGEVIFDHPMPYFIKNDQNNVKVIIDTTGKINNFSNEYPDLSILINKNQISFNLPPPRLFTLGQPTPIESKPMVQPFDKGTNLVFDSKKIVSENSIARLKYVTLAILYPTIVALFFSVFVIFFIVLSLLGQTFSTIFFSYKIGFTASCRVLVVAGTPMLFVLMVLLTCNKLFPGLGAILFFLLIAYYSFALYALRAESRQVVIS